LGSCSGEGPSSDLPGIHFLLLVDDRTLSKETKELFGDAIRDLGSGPLVFPSQTSRGAQRRTVIVGERFYRQGFESDSEMWATRVRDVSAVTAQNVSLTPSLPGPEPWMSSTFRFDLPNLPCERVERVDLIGWKQTIGAQSTAGEVSTAVEVSQLKLTISMADSRPWSDWTDAVVVRGQDDPRDATLTFYDPSAVREVARIDFSDVRIISMRVLPATGGQEELFRFEVELSVERVELCVEPTAS
jgi:hypothetical protein